jgi:hypothetical protein
VDFNKAKVMQDWTAWDCQQLWLPIPHLKTFSLHACTCRRFAIDEFGDHLHCCTQHAIATAGAHEHILTAVQRLFTMAGYKTDRKHVPHSRGLKKADLVVKNFRLAGIRDLIIDVSLRHEFHGACADPVRTGKHHTLTPTARSMQLSERSLTTTNTNTTSATSFSFPQS